MTRTLVIAPTAEERAHFQGVLARGGHSEAEDGGDLDLAVSRCSTEVWGCVLVAHGEPGAMDLVRAVRERAPHVPILVVASKLDERLEGALVDAGATDVIAREECHPTRLGRRVRTAARIGDAAAAAAKRDELLSIVAHDLRSPLNAIVLACDALDSVMKEGDGNRYVAAIRRAGTRADRLLRDLLDVAKIEGGGLKLDRRHVTVRALLDQARADHEHAAREASSQLVVEVAGDPGQVMADRDRTNQVLAILVGNALKHAAGTTVRLEARGDGDQVVIAISDEGPGIPADALPRVFDRGFQGKTGRRGGAGLGLTIARGIVEAHGGTIEVTSELGKGTRFTVRLPKPRRES
jgi:signal transduction histidine kinase